MIEKGKIVKSIHYSFLNGKKIREENYNYSSDILIEKRIETYNNNEQVTKFPNYIYQVKYTYPNKKEKIEGRYFYENNKLKLRELSSILRFADELAEGPQRTCDYLINNNTYC